MQSRDRSLVELVRVHEDGVMQLADELLEAVFACLPSLCCLKMTHVDWTTAALEPLLDWQQKIFWNWSFSPAAPQLPEAAWSCEETNAIASCL